MSEQRSASRRQTDYGPESLGLPAALLHPRYWGVWAVAGLLWLLTLLPWWVRSAIAVLFGALACRASGKRRRIAEVNLQLCFPDLEPQQRRRLIQLHFRYKLRALLDYPILWWGSRRRLERLVHIEGEEHYREHFQAGRPVILFMPHSVALDFGASALARRYPGVGLIKPASNPLVNWLMLRGRLRFGGRLYTRRSGMLALVRAVRGGSFFYYLPDEDLGERASTFVPFFGVPAATLTTLGRLARACHAAVVPAATYYEPERGRYVLRLSPALQDFPTATAEQDALRMNRELERAIRRRPEQYLWTMKLFRTRPPGEPSFYGGD
jgi:KDO2-lipid IV(A) lauroyltransferase